MSSVYASCKNFSGQILVYCSIVKTYSTHLLQTEQWWQRSGFTIRQRLQKRMPFVKNKEKAKCKIRQIIFHRSKDFGFKNYSSSLSQ